MLLPKFTAVLHDAHPTFELMYVTVFHTLCDRSMVPPRSRHPATTLRRGVMSCRRPWWNLLSEGETEVGTISYSSSSRWTSNNAVRLITPRLHHEKEGKVDRFPAEIT